MKRLLLLSVFLVGCQATMVTDEDGNKTPASIVALEQVETSAANCLVQASDMLDNRTAVTLSAIPDDLPEIAIALLISQSMSTSAVSVSRSIDSCFAHVEVAIMQFNLSDQQRYSMGQRIATTAIAAGASIFFAQALATTVQEGFRNAGGTYNIAGPGGRQVIQSQDPTTVDGSVGVDLFGGDSTENPLGPSGGAPNGAVSSSGDGQVIGNQMNINIPQGDGSIVVHPLNSSNDNNLSDSPPTSEGAGSVNNESSPTK